jgi:hypothetical protein
LIEDDGYPDNFRQSDWLANLERIWVENMVAIWDEHDGEL